MIALIGAALAPGIALLSYFYLRDTFQPEPIHMVIRTFVFGLLIVFPIMMLQFVIQAEWGLNLNFFNEIVTAALVEEYFKWLVVFHTAYKHVEFDEPYDGIVYSVSVSLGFATMENLFYLLIHGMDIAIWRALLPVSSHALFGLWMGYFYGLGKFADTKRERLRSLWFSLLVPVVLHATYNLIFLIEDGWMWIMIPFLLIMWWQGLKKLQHVHDIGMKEKGLRPE